MASFAGTDIDCFKSAIGDQSAQRAPINLESVGSLSFRQEHDASEVIRSTGFKSTPIKTIAVLDLSGAYSVEFSPDNMPRRDARSRRGLTSQRSRKCSGELDSRGSEPA